MSINKKVKLLVHRIFYYSKLSSLMALRQNCRRIIMFHGTPKHSAIAFHEQIAYLTRHFNIVSLDKMIENSSNDKIVSKNRDIAITFDDGLRNNVKVAYPILRKFNAPATFFVCPGLIESRKWLWNHEARSRMQSLSPPALTELFEQLVSNTNSIEKTVEWLKTLTTQNRNQAEIIIREATSRFHPTLEQQDAFDIMNWDELSCLDPKLITIGSHTFTHPILLALKENEINFELLQSRYLLEEKVQRSINYFCYPNGSYDERVCTAVKKNYCAAVTVESGVLNGENKHDLHKLPRIPSADNVILTAWRLHRPWA